MKESSIRNYFSETAKPRRLVMVVGIAVVALSVALWYALNVEERAQIGRTIAAQTGNLSTEIKALIEPRILDLVRMGERWAVGAGTFEEELKADAALYIAHQPGYEAVLWIDPEFNVRWIVPTEGNEPAIGLSLASNERHRVALEMARNRRVSTFTRPIELAEGGKEFLIYVPVHVAGDQFAGFIGGRFRVNELFDAVAQKNMMLGYSIAVFDGNEEIYGRYGSGRAHEQEWGQDTEIQIQNVVWRARIWPTPELLAKLQSPLPAIALAMGFLMAFLLMLTLHFSQTAWRRAREVVRANRELATEINQRKRADHELRQITDQLSIILQSLPVICYTSKTEEGIGATYVSNNVAALTGYTPEDFASNPSFWADHIHPDDAPRILSGLAKLPEKGWFEHEYRWQIADGSYKWVYDFLRIIKRPDGDDDHIVGMMQDITERKKADEKLRFQAHLLDSARESVVATNLEDRIIYWGKGAEALYGYQEEEVMGKPITSILESYGDGDVRQRKETIYKTGSWSGQCEQRRKDGSMFMADMVISLVQDENGKPRGFISIDRDITQRKWADQALRVSEERYRALYNDNPSMYFTVDPEGVVLSVNRFGAEELGYAVDELLKRPVFMVCHQEDQAAARQHLEACLAQPNKVHQWEIRMIRKDSDEIWVRESARAIELPDQRVIILVVCENITERKRAEVHIRESHQRLRNLAARLHAVREEERTLIAREIHDELGQVLTGLKIDLSWMMNRLPKSWKTLPERVRSMISIVDTTLHSTRQLSARLRPPMLDDLGLEAAIEWQVEEFAARTGCKCDLRVDDEACGFDADRETAIFRILQESLTNVARHADASRVEVKLSPINGQVVLEVRDNGSGITEDAISGSGSLGLIGMRERAEALGGEVQIRRLPEGGTLVSLRMPFTP